jgi:branched-chain amino acid transport system ATP-binding protein
MLETRNLSVRYGAIQALSEVSLKVARGQLVVILGANGAGKSTLLRAISGLARAATGSILLGERDIGRDSPEAIVRHGVAHVPEGRGIFPDLTVRENLRIGAYARKPRRDVEADYQAALDIFPALRGREHQSGATLSGGEQQMLAIGRALMSRPSVVLADEVSLGLAPVVVKQVFAELARLKQRGITLLVVEQNANLALDFADHVYLLKYGRVVMDGSAAQIRASRGLVDAYLGVA